jgi:hypothetical protein
MGRFKLVVADSQVQPCFQVEEWTHVPVLYGSYIGFMEREVLGQKSPLYSSTIQTPKTPPSVVIYSFDRSKGAGRNDPKT